MIMQTPTLLWLVVSIVAILLVVLGCIIYFLYKQFSKTNTELQASRQQLHQIYGQSEHLKAQNGQLIKQHQDLDISYQNLQVKFDDLQNRYGILTNEYTQITTTLIQKEQHFAEQLKLLADNKQQLKLEFEQLASQIFEVKNNNFTVQSEQSLQALLRPFREQIDNFRQQVEQIHHAETVQKTQLSEELRFLKELNHQITQETHELTVALKGDKKMQGNWGELILENVLERAGLANNRDYFLQKYIHTPEGEAQLPDVIIQLPQQKHLIIDAKVSLNAYVKAINSTDETQQQLALKEHIKAITCRIKELSERFYHKSPDLNAPEIVIMFIPIEPAFIEAFKADENLFQKAIEQNILVATPTTLLASLTIIRQLWRLENQSRNTLELALLASKVYDKLRIFLSSMDNIEKGLNSAQENYQKAKKQLLAGKGNLVKLVDDFVELGVAVKNELPEEWQDKAKLELEHKQF